MSEGKSRVSITAAKTAGFCFGVDRAVSLVYSLLGEGKKVCTLGPLIHNPQVIDDLLSRGVRIIDEPSQALDGETVVIRAHGVPLSVEAKLEERPGGCCNATCPFVKKIHRIVAELPGKDSVVLIAGDANHPEVQGIKGHCAVESYVFNSLSELCALQEKHPEFSEKDIFAVAQTTFSTKEWNSCIKKIKIDYTKSNIFDTICNATYDRQSEAYKLSLENDAMLIVGGRQSSNTAKLKAVCEQNCKTFFVESAQELRNIDFEGIGSIGVTAGASTPAGIIKEVLHTMSEILNENEVSAEVEQLSAQTEQENAPAEQTAGQEAAEQAAGAVEVEETKKSFEALEESLKSMSSDQKVKGTVVGISPSEIQVDIGRKQAGYVPVDEYSSDPTADPSKELKIGDVLDLIIMKTNDAEGTMMLSKRRFDATKAWLDVCEAAETEAVLEGTVCEIIKGGVLVSYNGTRVFIPASHATLNRDDPLEPLLKTKVQFKIIDVNKQRKRAVGSIRLVAREARRGKAKEFWDNAAEGKVYTGVVKSMTSYGAFVDIGGVDGMIHISELSWKRVKHPSDVLTVGQTVEVYIKKLDVENKKISLGYRKVEDNPWEILRRDYPVGTVVEAKIVGMTTFGAFANIIPGIDGLIHISQIADRRVASPQEELSIDQVVNAKITDIDFDKKRVSLSIRALLPKNEEASDEEAPAQAQEAAAEEETAE